MKRLTAFLAAITLIGSVANIYTPTANALNTISFRDLSEQSEEEDAEKPDLEATHKKVTEGDFTFNVYADFAFLTDFSNLEAEEVEIPAEINGVPVVGVDGTPFGYCRNLKSITLPDSMQYFDWLDLVCIVTTVSSGSSGSHTVSVNTQLTEIDEETTFNPSNVTIMADENTDEDIIYPSVTEIKVSETNPYFTVSDGLLYSKDMKKVIGCPPAMDLTELIISEKAEIINDYAFATCYKLKDLVIPENIKQINNAAFVACINLESIELPESINAVHMDTFYMCESLSDVKFNGDISAIGIGAFGECTSLTEFDIPDSVTYIGASAFAESGCIEVKDGIHYVDNWAVDSEEDIVNAVFAEGTVGVAEWAFLMRCNIELVDFPESVTYVCDAFFLGTNDVTNKIHYRASYINEDTLKGAKSTSDIYIYDKDCDIFDSEKTIPAEFKIKEKMPDLENDGVITSVWGDVAGETVEEPEEPIDKSVVIHGYAGSTAQAYAEKYNRKFEVIEEEIPQTTTATTTTTVDTTTTTTTTASSTTTTTATTVETTTVTTEKPTEDVVPEFVKGDANGDGKMTIADAVSLTNWIMGVSDAKLENSEAADLCKDGKIDVFDLCLLREELIK
ncbi:MAG: leucine-rich repeat protein [Ruminococcus sp.]|nr:leucine-rich repeat protein [Ruminococcus sp.]